MFYDFGKNTSEASRFAAACRTAGAKSARLLLNEWKGRVTVQVACSKADEDVCSQLWDAYVASMVVGSAEENKPQLKTAKVA